MSRAKRKAGPAVAGIYSRIQQAPPSALWGESPASGEPPKVDRRMARREPVSKRFPAFIGLWGESPASGEPPKVDRRMARREPVSKRFPAFIGLWGESPGIIKYPFWQMTYRNPKAVYACVNLGEAYAPREIRERSICIDGNIGEVLKELDGNQA